MGREHAAAAAPLVLAGRAEQADAIAHTASWYAGLFYMRAQHRPAIPFGTWANLGTFFGEMPFQLFGCVLFTGELFTYWTHRLSHWWRFLWRFHAVHHSSEDADWLSAHRQHPFDTILSLIAANVPAIAIGFSGPLLVFIAVCHRAFVTFTHVTTRLELRWFRWLIVTPRCHHHHHDRDAPPSNFASLFPIFDVIFGTFHWPRALPEQYGVRHRVSERWLGQLFLPLVQTPAAREATSIKVFQNTKSPL